jgi:hypothetical protein
VGFPATWLAVSGTLRSRGYGGLRQFLDAEKIGTAHYVKRGTPSSLPRPQHPASYWRARCLVTDDDIREAGDLGNPDVIGDCNEADRAVYEWARRAGIDPDDLGHGLVAQSEVVNALATRVGRPAQDVLDEIITIRRGLT